MAGKLGVLKANLEKEETNLSHARIEAVRDVIFPAWKQALFENRERELKLQRDKVDMEEARLMDLLVEIVECQRGK